MPDCSICLEQCKQPAQLKLRCQCKYCVHFKCYKTWWDEKHNCIICRRRSNKPMPYRLTHNNFEKITANIKLVYSRSVTYLTYRQRFILGPRRQRGRRRRRARAYAGICEMRYTTDTIILFLLLFIMSITIGKFIKFYFKTDASYYN